MPLTFATTLSRRSALMKISQIAGALQKSFALLSRHTRRFFSDCFHFGYGGGGEISCSKHLSWALK
jgi:hypothetical protein